MESRNPGQTSWAWKIARAIPTREADGRNQNSDSRKPPAIVAAFNEGR